MQSTGVNFLALISHVKKRCVLRDHIFSNITTLTILISLALFSTLLSCNQSSERAQKDTVVEVIESDNTNTIKVVLQLTLDAEKLQGFYHFDNPGRSILCVSGKDIPSELYLEKNDNPVKVVESIEECENCLIFESIEVKKSTIEIRLSYPIEGLKGQFSFEITDRGWLLKTSELVEI